MAIAAALIINELTKKGSLLKIVIYSVLITSLGINLIYETILDKPKISTALGRHSNESFYRNNNYLFYDSYNYINKNLPKDAKILVCHNRIYGLRRDYLVFESKTQKVIDFVKISNKDMLLDRLKELQITYIVAAPPKQEDAEDENGVGENKPREKRGPLTQKLKFLDAPLTLMPQSVKEYFSSAGYQTVSKERYNWEENTRQALDDILRNDADEIFNANEQSVWKLR